ncbi:hypothetical protein C9374_012796 [Naegleria lovaniensis]|uniref:TFIID subunit TAF5 NTD2 domain-containing protein n=1 Tax=Naegleria lovaniensis TaxID=51637 RepID=A0AA88GCK4_NAELO|nr:uncharacterized protein C9374_012796 [Naegleria lovaniensis]KAG2373194.1 hypothetical protein C9374_012796 [Naegleria lovaniensis]
MSSGTEASSSTQNTPSLTSENVQQQEKMKELVLKFLQQNGFQRSVKALEEELNGLPSGQNLVTTDISEFASTYDLGSANGESEVINSFISDRQSGKGYLQAYQSLTDWVFSSLEIYKNELVQVLYPVFVHCYLELVSKGHIEEARKFLNKYKNQHSHFHYDEILTLQSLQSPEIMAQNEFSKRLLSHKFIIRLSEASFHLLMKFLQDSSELKLLSILNQYVNFKTYKGQPSLQAPAMIDGILLMDHDIKAQQQKKKRKATSEEAEGSEDEDLTEDDEDELEAIFGKNKKINWEVENREKEEVLASAVTVPETPVAPQPSRRGRKKKGASTAAQAEIKKLIDIAKEQVPVCPSVCFYTLFNCSSNLNTVEIGTNFEHKPSNYFIEDGDFAPQYNLRNGPVIAAGFSDSTIRCWNWRILNGTIPNTKSYARSAENVNSDDNENRECQYETLVGHSGPVYSLSFNSDQQWLLSGSEDCTARLWNVNNSECVVVYKGHQYAVWNVSFSPTDYMFATASHDRTARLWVTDRVTPVRVLAGHLSDVECVKFHPNCNYVATGSSDKTVRLWDVQTGECMRMFIGHHGSINTLAFSHDGRYCASAGDDQQVIVWDIGSGKIAYKFIGHTGSIWSLDFNRNDTFLASASLDCTVRVWSMFDTIDTGSSAESAAQILKEKKLELNKHKIISKEPYKTYFTKQSPVYSLKFTQQDFVVASGGFNF